MHVLQTGPHDRGTWFAAVVYLLTHAGAAQVGDYLAAVCDYNRAGSAMTKQLTNFFQQSLTHQDVLENQNHRNITNNGASTAQSGICIPPLWHLVITDSGEGKRIFQEIFQLWLTVTDSIIMVLLCRKSYIVWWVRRQCRQQSDSWLRRRRFQQRLQRQHTVKLHQLLLD